MPNEREKGSKVIIFKRRDINTQKLEEEIAEEGKGFVEIPVGSDSGLPIVISSNGIFSISTLENLSNRNHQQEKKRKKKKERQNP